MSPLKSTLLHGLELAILLIVAYVAKVIFNVHNDVVVNAVVVALGLAVKFARASDSVPLKDYVNE